MADQGPDGQAAFNPQAAPQPAAGARHARPRSQRHIGEVAATAAAAWRSAWRGSALPAVWVMAEAAASLAAALFLLYRLGVLRDVTGHAGDPRLRGLGVTIGPGSGVLGRLVVLVALLPYVAAAVFGGVVESAFGMFGWARFWANGFRYFWKPYRLALSLLVSIGCFAILGSAWTAVWWSFRQPVGPDIALGGDLVVVWMLSGQAFLLGPTVFAAHGVSAWRTVRRRWRSVLPMSAISALVLGILGSLWSLARRRGPVPLVLVTGIVVYAALMAFAWAASYMRLLGAPGPTSAPGQRTTAPGGGLCPSWHTVMPAGVAFCAACGARLNVVAADPIPEAGRG